MLTLNKNEPSCFVKFKRKHKPRNYEKDCDHEVRACLREALLQEQRGQCFYCEQKIKDSHIEHYIPRDANLKNTECNYNNLFLSCDAKTHCGIKKSNKFDESRYMRLFSIKYELDNPSDFFEYSRQGKIKAKKNLLEDEKERAINTIELLNLNDNELVNVRRKIFLNINIYEKSGLDIDIIFDYFREFESLFR